MNALSRRNRHFVAAATLLLAGCSSVPAAPEPAPARIAIHRLFSQSLGDHLYGRNPNEPGYVLEARDYFYLEATSGPGHVPLYRCHTLATHDHFVSTAATCEGAAGEGLLGYVATSQVAGTVPLYRLHRAGTGNTFYTMSAEEAENAVFQYAYAHQGVTGYVYPTP